VRHFSQCYQRLPSCWFTSQQGFSVGLTTVWEERNHGAPTDPVISKYILVDMYAKAVQGMAPAEAVKWAHGELVYA
jgi:multiple sugar transport system substrate-binding protein